MGATPENMNNYGPPINLENAKKVVALALAEARKNNWTMAAAIATGAMPGQDHSLRAHGNT
jgi:hypothetical protein